MSLTHVLEAEILDLARKAGAMTMNGCDVGGRVPEDRRIGCVAPAPRDPVLGSPAVEVPCGRETRVKGLGTG